MMSGRMTRGTFVFKGGGALQFDQFRRLALVQPARDPRRLFAGQALAIEQITAAIELEQDPAQTFQFRRQFGAQRKGRGRNAPILPGKQAAVGQSRADEARRSRRSHECGGSSHCRFKFRTWPLPMPTHL